MGLWRSWERASMAWKRSPVRSRSGPPNNPFKNQVDTGCRLSPSISDFVSFVSKALSCVRQPCGGHSSECRLIPTFSMSPFWEHPIARSSQLIELIVE
jgi:hypothetical protein